MEVVEVITKKPRELPCRKTVPCPCDVKTPCTRKYVQPARVKSFAPELAYNPPTNPLEANTTYHLSYLNVDRIRSQPIRPSPALEKLQGRLSDETTNKLSYRPVWNVPRTKPIVPRHRSMTQSGLMECVTTVRRDYVKKCVDRPEIVVPRGNIRTSTGPLDDRTTATLSYATPGPVQPTVNFKPITIYCPPTEPIPDLTTQKLSYQPFSVPEKEAHSWKLKPSYKPPDAAMCGKTTYSESYLKNEDPRMEKPIVPSGTSILPHGAEFTENTIYKESYLPCEYDRVTPFLPCNSISLPAEKMSVDTTSKLSYQRVRSEKRAPILPPCKNMMGDGPMQSETTSSCAFVAKATLRPELVVPSNNLRNSEAPIDDGTTAKLSYVKPERTELVQSFKPVLRYCRPVEKLDTETVSKLSFQAWRPNAKDAMPWARKNKYLPPTAPMCGDSIYHMSYSPPGHYVVDDCQCPGPMEDVRA